MEIFLFVLALSMLFLIFICVLLLVEFSQGIDGDIYGSGIAYYLIEPFPILICCSIFLLTKSPYRVWNIISCNTWIDKFSNNQSKVNFGGEVGIDG